MPGIETILHCEKSVSGHSNDWVSYLSHWFVCKACLMSDPGIQTGARELAEDARLLSSCLNSLPPGWCGRNLKTQLKTQFEGILPKGPYPPCVSMAGRVLLAGYPRIFKLRKLNRSLDTHFEIDPRWMPYNLTNERSTLVQVMVYCRQTTSPYLRQCWPRSMSLYGVNRPHC